MDSGMGEPLGKVAYWLKQITLKDDKLKFNAANSFMGRK